MRSLWTAALVAALVLAAGACARNSPAPGGTGPDLGSGPGARPPATAPEPTVVLRGAGNLDVAAAPTAIESADALPRRSTPVTLRSPEYGVQAFLWWRREMAERDMLTVKDMGFRWIKQGFGWRDIELVKGEFDWSHTDHIVRKVLEYGDLDLVARIDHQPEWARTGCSMQGPPRNLVDYADFLTALATRYRGQIAAYQIWNEPNLAREWCDQSPDPAAYAAMLQTAYGAIKAADPSAYVISAGLAPTGTQPPEAMPDDVFLDRLYQAMGGSSRGFFDLLGVHAPGFAAPPETSPDEAAASEAYGGERYFTFRRVEDLRAIQERYGDGATRVAVLEMGWTSDTVHPSYAWHAVSEQTKADYLARAYRYAAANWQPWATIMSAIYICNPDWTEADEQYWWCITNPDGTPRPAFDALKAMPKTQG
jgi:polysaccharide biosynthesis protein PslG